MAPRWSRNAVAAIAAPFLLALLAGCAGDYPQSTLNPLGDFARIVDGVFRTTLFWATVVFVLVEGALLYVVLKFRGRPDDPQPKQIHGNTTAEIIWTAIPALVLAMIAVPTVRAIFRTYRAPDTANPLEVEVIGHQWWWEFRYPEYGVTTANELHVPVGRTVTLRMTAGDVLHSFWVPQFAAKRDVFPGRQTTMWFTAEKPGDYPAQCAEFCGIQHGRMAFRVVADEPAAFDAHMTMLRASGGAPPAAATASADGLRSASVGASVALDTVAADTAKAAPPPEDPAVAAGKQLYLAKGCLGCHSTDATKPMGIGPNLAGIGSRSYIGAGSWKNTDDALVRWVQNPQAMKEGVLMPNLQLTEAEARSIVAYLRTLK